MRPVRAGGRHSHCGFVWVLWSLPQKQVRSQGSLPHGGRNFERSLGLPAKVTHAGLTQRFCSFFSWQNQGCSSWFGFTPAHTHPAMTSLPSAVTLGRGSLVQDPISPKGKKPKSTRETRNAAQPHGAHTAGWWGAPPRHEQPLHPADPQGDTELGAGEGAGPGPWGCVSLGTVAGGARGSKGGWVTPSESPGSWSEFPTVAERKIKVIKLEEENSSQTCASRSGTARLGGPLLAQELQGRGPGPLLAHS